MVEWLGRKPCWDGERGMWWVSVGRSRRSKTFIAGHRRDMGRYPDPKPAGLPGFRTGIIVDCFHIEGMSALL